jgi:hypothetical protein
MKVLHSEAMGMGYRYCPVHIRARARCQTVLQALQQQPVTSAELDLELQQTLFSNRLGAASTPRGACLMQVYSTWMFTNCAPGEMQLLT